MNVTPFSDHIENLTQQLTLIKKERDALKAQLEAVTKGSFDNATLMTVENAQLRAACNDWKRRYNVCTVAKERVEARVERLRAVLEIIAGSRWHHEPALPNGQRRTPAGLAQEALAADEPKQEEK